MVGNVRVGESREVRHCCPDVDIVGVGKVTIHAHSNGGVAIEVAAEGPTKDLYSRVVLEVGDPKLVDGAYFPIPRQNSSFTKGGVDAQGSADDVFGKAVACPLVWAMNALSTKAVYLTIPIRKTAIHHASLMNSRDIIAPGKREQRYIVVVRPFKIRSHRILRHYVALVLLCGFSCPSQHVGR